MREYIFFTDEGYTYQAGSESIEPDIENMQVLGFACGLSAEDAYYALLRKSPWLLETSFSSTYCMPLAGRWARDATWFPIPPARSARHPDSPHSKRN